MSVQFWNPVGTLEDTGGELLPPHRSLAVTWLKEKRRKEGMLFIASKGFLKATAETGDRESSCNHIREKNDPGSLLKGLTHIQHGNHSTHFVKYIKKVT